MSQPDEIEEFLAALSLMDDNTVSLLEAYYYARDEAWRKLYRLDSLAAASEGGPPPAWSRWHQTVPRRQQVRLVASLARLINSELERRRKAADEAERARKATITTRDAEGLSDAELTAMRLILNSAIDSPQSRWRLLAGLVGLYSGGMRPSGWRKWCRIAEGPEEARTAASSILEAEARRRGLDDPGDPSDPLDLVAAPVP